MSNIETIFIETFKEFVLFVLSFDKSDTKLEINALKIIEKLDTDNSSKIIKDGSICINLFDEDLQCRKDNREGIYWKHWSIYIEKNRIEIIAQTKHSDEPLNHYGNDFNCELSFSMNDITLENVEVFKQFVADAKVYNSYLTNKLSSIETSIEIFQY